MKLFEHEGKALLRAHGIPVPEGILVGSPEEAESAARKLGDAVVVKAQVLAGGRGKSGGIQAAASAPEAGLIASSLLHLDLSGHKVDQLLIERQVPIARELYLAVTIDSQRAQPLLLFSPEGGVDIEELAGSDTGPPAESSDRRAGRTAALSDADRCQGGGHRSMSLYSPGRTLSEALQCFPRRRCFGRRGQPPRS